MEIGTEPVTEAGRGQAEGGDIGEGIGAEPRAEDGGEQNEEEKRKNEAGFHEGRRMRGSRRAVSQSVRRLKKMRRTE